MKVMAAQVAGRRFTRLRTTVRDSRVFRRHRPRIHLATRRVGADLAADWASRSGPKTDAAFITCQAAAFILSPFPLRPQATMPQQRRSVDSVVEVIAAAELLC